eukprot:s6216_g4.t1
MESGFKSLLAAGRAPALRGGVAGAAQALQNISPHGSLGELRALLRVFILRGLLEYRDDELVPTVVLLKDLDTLRQAPPRTPERKKRPKLPVQWFALSLIAQSAGLLCQLICGWTVLSGCCLLFFYGCELVCHLFYYSSTVVENSTTTLPTLSMGALVIWFVLSGWGGLFWVCASGAIGMVFGKFFLDFLKVQPLGESSPLTAQASQRRRLQQDLPANLVRSQLPVSRWGVVLHRAMISDDPQ